MGSCCSSSFCRRVKVLITPVLIEESFIDHKSGHVGVTFVPESIRVWFYLLFVIFTCIGAISTYIGSWAGWNDFKFDDNIMVNTFGYGNLCIFYDDPPFSYFGAALFEPILVIVFVYALFDLMRVYLDYAGNGTVSRRFWMLYASFTLTEFVLFTLFIQVFATQPTQDIVIHHVPFMGLQLGLWFMGYQHFLYFYTIGVIKKTSPYFTLGIVYLIVMFMTFVITVVIDVPNMFLADEDKLWKQDKFKFTKELSSINNKLFLITVLICPIIIYFFFMDKLRSVQVSFKLMGFPGKASKKEELIVNVEAGAPEK